MANPSDTTYAIIRETVEGTTPASPAFLNLEYSTGSLDVDTRMLTSENRNRNRDVMAYRKAGFDVSGQMATDMRRDTAWDMLRESGFSGRFNANVLKAGNTDSFHTVEKRMVEAGSPLFQRYTGVQVTRYGFTVDDSGNVKETFDLIGLSRSTGTAIIPSATYADPTKGASVLAGIDVGTITIGGQTGRFTLLDFSIGHTREAQRQLGSKFATGIGTSGNRETKLSVKLFRKDFTFDAMFDSDNPVPVIIAIGSGANGFRLDLPAAVGSMPKGEESGSKELINIDLMPQYDNTAATSVMLTRLA